MPEEYETEDVGEEDTISEEDIDRLIERTEKAEASNLNLTRTISSIQDERKDINILHLQISTEEMLAKLEHFYRGDVLGTDNEGAPEWKAQKNPDLITFNEFGVTSLMEIVTKYIDRNTILSYYSENRIYEILGDLGDELVLFMVCNYQKLGMDTYFKKTKFRIIITTTLHIIESTYRRAIRGKTIEEINQSKIIGQFGEIPREISKVPQMKKRWIDRFIS